MQARQDFLDILYEYAGENNKSKIVIISTLQLFPIDLPIHLYWKEKKSDRSKIQNSMVNILPVPECKRQRWKTRRRHS